MLHNAVHSLQDLDNAALGEFSHRDYFTFNNISQLPQGASRMNTNSRMTCEFCHESCCSYLYQDHKRICKQNPLNIVTVLEFHRKKFPLTNENNTEVQRQQQTQQQSQQQEQRQADKENIPKHNFGVQKTICVYCNQPCYLAFHDDHKRVCQKNPENVKIGCKTCKKTYTISAYEGHLTHCEGNGPDFNPRAQLLSTVSETKNIVSDQKCEGQEKGSSEEKPRLEIDCPICIEEIKGFYQMKTLPCSHKFHKNCIEKWARKQKKCPICRHRFV